jgi:DNA (cytosine-5)-methyltransferase 1
LTAYYNENDAYAAQWLRNLIAEGLIAPGDVDDRSIEDLRASDLIGYTQCHFFAGIGVWSHALRRAGWPDDRPVWTGSCPCQPFSAAGRRGGVEDKRHLYPTWGALIVAGAPVVVFGEQVASRDGLTWLDIVYAHLEGAGYAVRAVDLCAAGVGAPHIRQRLWFVAERGGLTGWPTPSAQQFETADEAQLNARREACKARTGNGNGFGLTLANTAMLASWNTPRATDGSNGGPHQAGGGSIGRCSVDALADASDERRREARRAESRGGLGRCSSLSVMANAESTGR